MKYLKKFSAHSDYITFTLTEDYIFPNVSYCVQEDEVHYSVSLLKSIPNNVIKYYSTRDLTLNNYSISTVAFYNDEDTLNLVSYTYDSESQLSIMEFDGDVQYIDSAFCLDDSRYIERIEFPASVVEINYDTFVSASSVDTLVIYANTPPVVYTTAYNTGLILPQNCEIYVPDRAVDSYKNAPIWEDYASNIYPLSELEEYEPPVVVNPEK